MEDRGRDELREFAANRAFNSATSTRSPAINAAWEATSTSSVIVEGKRLGAGVDCRCGAGGALGAHGRARLDGEYPAILGLVGPCARADVEHRARTAERGTNARGDTWVRAAMPCIGAPVALIVNPSSHRSTVTRRLPAIFIPSITHWISV